jgi:hypothetical protein
VFGTQDIDVLRMPVHDLLDDLAVTTASYMASFSMKASSLEPVPLEY